MAKMAAQGDQAKRIVKAEVREIRRNLLGTAVWFAHLNLVHPLNSLACKWGWFPNEIAGMPSLRFVQLLLTLAVGLLLTPLILSSWRIWRLFQTDGAHLLERTQNNPQALLGCVTMLLNALYLLLAIAALVPILALHPCG